MRNGMQSAPTNYSKTIRPTQAYSFKKLEGHENIYSVRIGLGYRALGVRKNDKVVWYWIGNHADYDRIV